MKQIVFVLLVTAVAYANIFLNGPVIDDKIFLGKYCPSVVEAFRGVVPKGHEGVYRPVRGVIYSVYCRAFGSNVWGYHLHSLLVHLAATGLVYLIVGALRATPLLSFIAALLFGLHPVHTESITYIAASMEMTGIVFMLASFWLYLTHTSFPRAESSPRGRRESIWRWIPAFAGMTDVRYVLSILFAALAFFTYEMTLTLPLLILWYEFLYHPLPPLNLRGGDRTRSGVIWVGAKSRAPTVIPAKARIYINRSWIPAYAGMTRKTGMTRGAGMTRRIWPYFGVLFLYLLVRMGSVGVTGRAPYLANSVYLTAITMPKVMVKYLQLMVWPVNLANNHIISPGIEAFVYRGYRTEAIAAQSILDPEILWGIGLIGGIGGIGWKMRERNPMISFGIGWFFISLLPVLEIVPQGSMLNEKSLYLASVGWIIGMIGGIREMGGKMRGKMGKIIIVGILLFYGGGTIIRNSQWRDEITLWGREVAIYPTESAYGRFSLGDAYYREKKYPEAIEEYKKSVEINPRFAVGYASLARTYADINQVELSNLNYQLAGQVEPGFWQRP